AGAEPRPDVAAVPLLMVRGVAVPMHGCLHEAVDIGAVGVRGAVLAHVDLSPRSRRVADILAFGGGLQPERRPHAGRGMEVNTGLQVAKPVTELAIGGKDGAVVRAVGGVGGDGQVAAADRRRIRGVYGVAVRAAPGRPFGAVERGAAEFVCPYQVVTGWRRSRDRRND